MTEKILVGIDGQPSSARALEWALQRADTRGARVEVVVAVDVPRPPVGTKEHTQALVDAAQRVADAAVAEAREKSGVVDVRGVVERGDVVQVFERLSPDSSLVVIGTNHVSAVQSIVRGTRSVRIAASSSAPVIVVPDVTLESRRGVVVGVDGSPTSEHAIAFAAAEADRLGEPLTAVNAWQLPTTFSYDYILPMDIAASFEEQARENTAISLAGLAATYPDLEVVTEVKNADAADALIEHSRTASLVVVGHRGLGPVRRLLLGSVSHSLLLHATSPLAIVR